jgi:hypothetical protein
MSVYSVCVRLTVMALNRSGQGRRAGPKGRAEGQGRRAGQKGRAEVCVVFVWIGVGNSPQWLCGGIRLLVIAAEPNTSLHRGARQPLFIYPTFLGRPLDVQAFK